MAHKTKKVPNILECYKIWMIKAALRVIAIAVLGFTTIAVVQNGIVRADQAKIFVSAYQGDSKNENFRKIENNSITLSSSTTLRIKGLIEPITKKKNTKSRIRKIDIKDKDFICQDKECFKSWNFDLSRTPISFKNYRNLQLSWNKSLDEDDPKFSVELSIKTPNTKKITKLIGNYGGKIKTYTPLKKIKFADAKYVTKNKLYTLKRELGLNISDEWRYSYKNRELILQKIVNVPIKHLHAVRITSSNKIKPRIVQFSIDANGNGCRDGYILFEELKESNENAGGKSILTLDLRPAILKKKFDLNKAILLEAIIFLPSNFNEYIASRPLHTIEFLGSKDDDYGIDLGYKKGSKDNLESIKFNLHEQESYKKYADGQITGMTIRSKLSVNRYFEWNKIEFFDVGEQTVPAIYDAPLIALKNWGDDIAFDDQKTIISFRPIFTKVIVGSSNKHNEGGGEYDIQPTSEIIDFSFKKNSKRKINQKVIRKKHESITEHTYCFVSGCKKNSLVRANLLTEKNLKGIPLYLSEGLNKIEKKFNKNDFISDLQFNDSIYIEKLPMQVSFFNIIFRNSQDLRNIAELEWWDKNARLRFNIYGRNDLVNTNEARLSLVTEKGKKNKWIFELPNAEFILPIKFAIPGPLPQPCKMVLSVGDENIEIPYGPFSLPMEKYINGIKDIKISFEYFGNKPVIWIDVPEIQVIGLKRTANDDCSRIKILVDGKNIISSNMLKMKDIEDEWVNIEGIELNKGTHEIKTENSRYFKIRSLILETDTLKQSKFDGYKEKVKNSLLNRLLFLFLKLLASIFVCIILYIFLKKTKNITKAIFEPIIKIYEQCPRRILIYGWVILAACLYLYGMAYEGDDNQGFSLAMGDIAIVFFLFHLGESMEVKMRKKFPRATSHIYYDKGSLFLTLATVILIFTAIFTSVKFEIIADKSAIIVFYMFVLGIIFKAAKSYRK